MAGVNGLPDGTGLNPNVSEDASSKITSSPKTLREANIEGISQKSLLSKSGGALDSPTTRVRAQTITPKSLLASSGGGSRPPTLETTGNVSREALKMSGGPSSLRESSALASSGSITSSSQTNSPSLLREVGPATTQKAKYERARGEWTNSEKVIKALSTQISGLNEEAKIEKDPDKKAALENQSKMLEVPLQKATKNRDTNKDFCESFDKQENPELKLKGNPTKVPIIPLKGQESSVNQYQFINDGAASKTFFAQDPATRSIYCLVEHTGPSYVKNETEIRGEVKLAQAKRDELRKLVGDIAPRDMARVAYTPSPDQPGLYMTTHGDELLNDLARVKEDPVLEHKLTFCDQLVKKEQEMSKHLIHRDIKPENTMCRFADNMEAGNRDPVLIDWDGYCTEEEMTKMSQKDFKTFLSKSDITQQYTTPRWGAIRDRARNQVDAAVDSNTELPKKELASLKKEMYQLEKERDSYDTAITAYTIITGKVKPDLLTARSNYFDPEKMSNDLDTVKDVAKNNPELYMFMKGQFNKATNEMKQFEHEDVTKYLPAEKSEYKAGVSALYILQGWIPAGTLSKPEEMLNMFYTSPSITNSDGSRFHETNPKTSAFITQQLVGKIKENGPSADLATKYPEVAKRHPEIWK